MTPPLSHPRRRSRNRQVEDCSDETYCACYSGLVRERCRMLLNKKNPPFIRPSPPYSITPNPFPLLDQMNSNLHSIWRIISKWSISTAPTPSTLNPGRRGGRKKGGLKKKPRGLAWLDMAWHGLAWHPSRDGPTHFSFLRIGVAHGMSAPIRLKGCRFSAQGGCFAVA